MNTINTYVNTCQKHISSKAGEPAREYLADRGIEDTDIERFRIGYNPDQKRVVFPVLGCGGTAVGTTDRTIVGRDPKYTHTRGFQSKRFLYGLHIPAASIPILVEGPTDVILMRQFGYDAYGVFGRTVSDVQAVWTGWLGNGTAIVFPDRDSEDIAWDSRSLLWEYDVRAYVLQGAYDLVGPDIDDPAMFVREAKDILSMSIKTAMDYGRKNERTIKSDHRGFADKLREICRPHLPTDPRT